MRSNSSFQEHADLAARLHGWKGYKWDEQMKRDVAAGKLDTVLREVDEDIAAGATARHAVKSIFHFNL